jgi:hypothetical protein
LAPLRLGSFLNVLPAPPGAGAGGAPIVNRAPPVGGAGAVALNGDVGVVPPECEKLNPPDVGCGRLEVPTAGEPG